MAKWSNKKLTKTPIKRSPVVAPVGHAKPSFKGGEKAQTKGLGKALSTAWKRLSTHRAVYCGLASAYAAICLGVDKEVVNMAVTALYTALALQR